MSFTGKIRPLLATARIANVPSVVSNVWAGIVIGASFQRWEHPGSIWLEALGLAIAGVLLYIAGNFLNDWHDREWDAKNRPERALPAGLFSPATYLLLAVIFALSALSLATLIDLKSGLVALLVTISIAIYTRWHKHAIWPVIPMGLCRALLPVMGFVAFSSSENLNLSGNSPLFPSETAFILAHAAALFLYIAGLSLNARYESSPTPSLPALTFSKSLLVLSGLVATIFWFVLKPFASLIGLVPFAIWLALCLTKYRRPIPVHVSALLAGIPLVDWIALLAYALLQPVGHYPPALHPYLYACFLIPPIAFILGRLLQRVAPAT